VRKIYLRRFNHKECGVQPPCACSAPKSVNATGLSDCQVPLVSAGRERAERRYEVMLNTTMDGFWLLDAEGNILEANDLYCRLTGFSREELLSMNLLDFKVGATAESMASLLSWIKEVKAARFESQHRAKDGQVIDIEVSITYQPEEGGRLFAFMRDIRDRKRADEALRKSEERFQLAALASGDAVYDFDLAADTLWLSERFETLFGQKPEPSRSSPAWWTKLIHAEDSAHVKAKFAAAVQDDHGIWEQEYRVRRGDGSYAHVLDRGYFVRDAGGRAHRMVGTVADITQRKLTEQRLRRQNETIMRLAKGQTGAGFSASLKKVTQAASRTVACGRVSVWVFNDDRSELRCLDLYQAATNRHFRGQVFKRDIYPSCFDSLDDEPIVIADDARNHPATREFSDNYLQPLGITSMLSAPVRVGGSVIGIVCYEHTGPQRRWELDEQIFAGSVADAVSLLMEIDLRAQAEKALLRSEERYRDLVENAKDIIYTRDLQGNCTSINKVVEQVLGYTREEALGMNIWETVSSESQKKIQEMVMRKLAGEGMAVFEMEAMAKNGRKVTLEVNTRLVHEGGVLVGVQGIARDVTERRQLEEQLRQSQKMEAVGQLAGGVAHDFNNILAVIIGYSDILLNKLKQEDPTRRKITEIRKSAERAANLTGQLLAFSRRQVMQPAVIDLNATVKDMSEMFRQLIGENIELHTSFEEGLGPVKADLGQIQQVIMNLIVNARDAMPQGGHLTIGTQNAYLRDENLGRLYRVKEGHYVMLAVSDTGCGMDTEMQAHVFEPFFTTKEKGKGTGLGLSTVYGIVKQSGGYIWVFSEVGRGTTFKIYLPLIEEEVEEVNTSVTPAEQLNGTETVLLVEDEENVRRLACEILEMNGYTVIEAKDGVEALEVCDRYEGPIQLMLTDVVMPRLGGRELSQRLAPLRPQMRVLYMSGYTDDAIVRHGAFDRDIHFLQKPFTPEALARKVRQAISADFPHPANTIS
jgi:two-component system, cell cycle sensor histidine kinase and response regulator CckA